MTRFSNHYALILSILLAALGTVSCVETTQNSTIKSKANASANANLTYNSTGNSSIATVKNQDLIMSNLNEVIYSWSPEQEYAVATELRHIWVKSGNRPWEYPTKGAKKLIKDIQANAYFKSCPQARNLKVKMFTTNGEIQTIGHLYNELYYCDSNHN